MDIRGKIEAFFNAELTLQEEQELYRYLCENDVPEDLQEDKKAVIVMCGYTGDFSMPDDVEERLTAFVDALCEQENETVAPVAKAERPQQRILKIPISVWATLSVAAVLVFAFMIKYDKIYDSTPKVEQPALDVQIAQTEVDDPEQDTFATPEEVLSFVKGSLEEALMTMAMAHKEVKKVNGELACMAYKYRIIKKKK